MTIGIAGTGRLAQALGRLLSARGEAVAAVAGRNAAHAADAAAFIGGGALGVRIAELPERAERIVIAVSDDAVAAVARELTEAGMRSGLALHTCGALGPEALSALARAGVSCGVLHPLQTIASPEQGVSDLPGCAFAISGDAEAAAWAERICTLLDGVPLRVAPDRMALYHAAAVMASNCVTGLIDAAVILMEAAGIERNTALGALGPLVRASSENAAALGPERALTGPIRRGDVETVHRHLAALRAAPVSVGELYRAASLHLVELARRSGLAEAKAREIEALLRQGR